MQKKGLFAIGILSLFIIPLIPMISAYGGLSLTNQIEFFFAENIETIIYTTIFLGILILIKTSLSKILKGATGGILSALISIIATYGIYTQQYDINESLYRLGITGNMVPILFGILAIILIGFIKSKFNLSIPEWLKNLKLVLFIGGVILIIIHQMMGYDAPDNLFNIGIIAVIASLLLFLFGKGKKGIKELINLKKKRDEKKNELDDKIKIAQSTNNQIDIKVVEDIQRKLTEIDDKIRRQEETIRRQEEETIRRQEEIIRKNTEITNREINITRNVETKVQNGNGTKKEISEVEKRRKGLLKKFNAEIKALELAISKKNISEETKKNWMIRLESIKNAKKKLTRFKRTGNLYKK